MRKLAAMAITFSILVGTGCRQVGEGEFEVDRPAIGVVTDTVQLPTVETEERQVTVPDVDIGRDTATVRVPTTDRY